ncbi:MAG: hypothetical protein JW797_06840 [Bradymonadales bacterium]|nr:hypothetical protein [Bradymonadales bacterium]
MSRVCYRVCQGVRIEPKAEGGHRIVVPGSDRVIQLDSSAVAPLLMVDGWRSTDEILFRFGLSGVSIPQPTLENIIRSLASVGVLEEVETEWLDLEIFPWPEHLCEGCGASCQGHWVGPLQPEFIARTLSRMEGLRKKHPQLVGKKPFVRVSPEDSALYLNSQSGQCLFLDDRMGCILHSEFGAEGKPTICQKFPHVRVEDGHSTRLGVGVQCLKHFKQVLGRQPVASERCWRVQNEKLDGRLYQYFPPRELVGSQDDLLQTVLEAEDGVFAMLHQVVGSKLRPSRADVPRRLESQAMDQLARLEADLREDPMVRSVSTCTGVYPERLRALRALARKDPFTQRVPLPVKSAEPGRTTGRVLVLNDALARFLFLRQTLLYSDLEHAMACFVLGLWVALRLCPPGEEGDEQFGEVLATWHRALQGPSARQALFAEQGDAVRFLGTFLRFWRGR